MDYNGNVTKLFDLDYLSGLIDGFLIGLDKSISFVFASFIVF